MKGNIKVASRSERAIVHTAEFLEEEKKLCEMEKYNPNFRISETFYSEKVVTKQVVSQKMSKNIKNVQTVSKMSNEKVNYAILKAQNDTFLNHLKEYSNLEQEAYLIFLSKHFNNDGVETRDKLVEVVQSRAGKPHSIIEIKNVHELDIMPSDGNSRKSYNVIEKIKTSPSKKEKVVMPSDESHSRRSYTINEKIKTPKKKQEPKQETQKQEAQKQLKSEPTKSGNVKEKPKLGVGMLKFKIGKSHKADKKSPDFEKLKNITEQFLEDCKKYSDMQNRFYVDFVQSGTSASPVSDKKVIKELGSPKKMQREMKEPGSPSKKGVFDKIKNFMGLKHDKHLKHDKYPKEYYDFIKEQCNIFLRHEKEFCDQDNTVIYDYNFKKIQNDKPKFVSVSQSQNLEFPVYENVKIPEVIKPPGVTRNRGEPKRESMSNLEEIIIEDVQKKPDMKTTAFKSSPEEPKKESGFNLKSMVSKGTQKMLGKGKPTKQNEQSKSEFEKFNTVTLKGDLNSPNINVVHSIEFNKEVRDKTETFLNDHKTHNDLQKTADENYVRNINFHDEHVYQNVNFVTATKPKLQVSGTNLQKEYDDYLRGQTHTLLAKEKVYHDLENEAYLKFINTTKPKVLEIIEPNLEERFQITLEEVDGKPKIDTIVIEEQTIASEPQEGSKQIRGDKEEEKMVKKIELALKNVEKVKSDERFKIIRQQSNQFLNKERSYNDSEKLAEAKFYEEKPTVFRRSKEENKGIISKIKHLIGKKEKSPKKKIADEDFKDVTQKFLVFQRNYCDLEEAIFQHYVKGIEAKLSPEERIKRRSVPQIHSLKPNEIHKNLVFKTDEFLKNQKNYSDEQKKEYEEFLKSTLNLKRTNSKDCLKSPKGKKSIIWKNKLKNIFHLDKEKKDNFEFNKAQTQAFLDDAQKYDDLEKTAYLKFVESHVSPVKKNVIPVYVAMPSERKISRENRQILNETNKFLISQKQYSDLEYEAFQKFRKTHKGTLKNRRWKSTENLLNKFKSMVHLGQEKPSKVAKKEANELLKLQTEKFIANQKLYSDWEENARKVFLNSNLLRSEHNVREKIVENLDIPLETKYEKTVITTVLNEPKKVERLVQKSSDEVIDIKKPDGKTESVKIKKVSLVGEINKSNNKPKHDVDSGLLGKQCQEFLIHERNYADVEFDAFQKFHNAHPSNLNGKKSPSKDNLFSKLKSMMHFGHDKTPKSVEKDDFDAVKRQTEEFLADQKRYSDIEENARKLFVARKSANMTEVVYAVISKNVQSPKPTFVKTLIKNEEIQPVKSRMLESSSEIGKQPLTKEVVYVKTTKTVESSVENVQSKVVVRTERKLEKIPIEKKIVQEVKNVDMATKEMKPLIINPKMHGVKKEHITESQNYPKETNLSSYALLNQTEDFLNSQKIYSDVENEGFQKFIASKKSTLGRKKPHHTSKESLLTKLKNKVNFGHEKPSKSAKKEAFDLLKLQTEKFIDNQKQYSDFEENARKLFLSRRPPMDEIIYVVKTRNTEQFQNVPLHVPSKFEVGVKENENLVQTPVEKMDTEKIVTEKNIAINVSPVSKEMKFAGTQKEKFEKKIDKPSEKQKKIEHKISKKVDGEVMRKLTKDFLDHEKKYSDLELQSFVNFQETHKGNKKAQNVQKEGLLTKLKSMVTFNHEKLSKAAPNREAFDILKLQTEKFIADQKQYTSFEEYARKSFKPLSSPTNFGVNKQSTQVIYQNIPLVDAKSESINAGKSNEKKWPVKESIQKSQIKSVVEANKTKNISVQDTKPKTQKHTVPVKKTQLEEKKLLVTPSASKTYKKEQLQKSELPSKENTSEASFIKSKVQSKHILSAIKQHDMQKAKDLQSNVPYGILKSRTHDFLVAQQKYADLENEAYRRFQENVPLRQQETKIEKSSKGVLSKLKGMIHHGGEKPEKPSKQSGSDVPYGILKLHTDNFLTSQKQYSDTEENARRIFVSNVFSKRPQPKIPSEIKEVSLLQEKPGGKIRKEKIVREEIKDVKSLPVTEKIALPQKAVLQTSNTEVVSPKVIKSFKQIDEFIENERKFSGVEHGDSLRYRRYFEKKIKHKKSEQKSGLLSKLKNIVRGSNEKLDKTKEPKVNFKALKLQTKQFIEGQKQYSSEEENARISFQKLKPQFQAVETIKKEKISVNQSASKKPKDETDLILRRQTFEFLNSQKQFSNFENGDSLKYREYFGNHLKVNNKESRPKKGVLSKIKNLMSEGHEKVPKHENAGVSYKVIKTETEKFLDDQKQYTDLQEDARKKHENKMLLKIVGEVASDQKSATPLRAQNLQTERVRIQNSAPVPQQSQPLGSAQNLQTEKIEIIQKSSLVPQQSQPTGPAQNSQTERVKITQKSSPVPQQSQPTGSAQNLQTEKVKIIQKSLPVPQQSQPTGSAQNLQTEKVKIVQKSLPILQQSQPEYQAQPKHQDGSEIDKRYTHRFLQNEKEYSHLEYAAYKLFIESRLASYINLPQCATAEKIEKKDDSFKIKNEPTVNKTKNIELLEQTKPVATKRTKSSKKIPESEENEFFKNKTIEFISDLKQYSDIEKQAFEKFQTSRSLTVKSPKSKKLKVKQRSFSKLKNIFKKRDKYPKKLPDDYGWIKNETEKFLRDQKYYNDLEKEAFEASKTIIYVNNTQKNDYSSKKEEPKSTFYVSSKEEIIPDTNNVSNIEVNLLKIVTEPLQVIKVHGNQDDSKKASEDFNKMKKLTETFLINQKVYGDQQKEIFERFNSKVRGFEEPLRKYKDVNEHNELKLRKSLGLEQGLVPEGVTLRQDVTTVSKTFGSEKDVNLISPKKVQLLKENVKVQQKSVTEPSQVIKVHENQDDSKKASEEFSKMKKLTETFLSNQKIYGDQQKEIFERFNSKVCGFEEPLRKYKDVNEQNELKLRKSLGLEKELVSEGVTLRKDVYTTVGSEKDHNLITPNKIQLFKENVEVQQKSVSAPFVGKQLELGGDEFTPKKMRSLPKLEGSIEPKLTKIKQEEITLVAPVRKLNKHEEVKMEKGRKGTTEKTVKLDSRKDFGIIKNQTQVFLNNQIDFSSLENQDLQLYKRGDEKRPLAPKRLSKQHVPAVESIKGPHKHASEIADSHYGRLRDVKPKKSVKDVTNVEKGKKSWFGNEKMVEKPTLKSDLDELNTTRQKLEIRKHTGLFLDHQKSYSDAENEAYVKFRTLRSDSNPRNSDECNTYETTTPPIAFKLNSHHVFEHDKKYYGDLTKTSLTFKQNPLPSTNFGQPRKERVKHTKIMDVAGTISPAKMNTFLKNHTEAFLDNERRFVSPQTDFTENDDLNNRLKQTGFQEKQYETSSNIHSKLIDADSTSRKEAEGVAEVLGESKIYHEIMLSNLDTDTIVTERKIQYDDGITRKKYTTTCYIQPISIPVWYTESLLLDIESRDQKLDEKIHYENKFRPNYWSENFVTPVTSKADTYFSEVIIPREITRDDNDGHIISLEPQQLSASDTIV